MNGEAQLFSEPNEPDLFTNPAVGQVWLLPATAPGGSRRVAVVDYNGTLQQVTYYGGRAFTHLGPAPEQVRDQIVDACKFVRDEHRMLNKESSNPVSVRVTEGFTPDTFLVYVDTLRSVTSLEVILNDGPSIFDGNPMEVDEG